MYKPDTQDKELPPFDIVVHDDVMALARDKADKNHRFMNVVNDYEMGKWRYDVFNDFAWDNIALTALSEEEREACINRPHTSLRKAAKRLKINDGNSPSNGSEIAESVLYGIMHKYFGALPVVPKIFHKQNNQLHAFGADSVHITKVGNDVNFWLGEAKIYNKFDINDLLNSIKNVLSSEYMRTENRIIREAKGLESYLGKTLFEQTKKMLSDDTSLDEYIVRLHVPILVLVECPIVAATTIKSDEFVNKIIGKYKTEAYNYFCKQFDKISNDHFLYNKITFHLILFPIPDKQKVLDRFVSEAKSLRAI